MSKAYGSIVAMTPEEFVYRENEKKRLAEQRKAEQLQQELIERYDAEQDAIMKKWEEDTAMIKEHYQKQIALMTAMYEKICQIQMSTFILPKGLIKVSEEV